MFGHAFAKIVENPLFKRSILGRMAGSLIRERGDKSHQTFPHHLGRKAKCIDLKWILRIRLRDGSQDRIVEWIVAPDLGANGDPALLEIALTNLLDNAWKFTAKHPSARIEFGRTAIAEGNAFYVRDDGAGFDMSHTQKLFGVFQRMHRDSEFPGTGVGLATAQRIIHRHGGTMWVEAQVERGATFYFTL